MIFKLFLVSDFVSDILKKFENVLAFREWDILFWTTRLQESIISGLKFIVKRSQRTFYLCSIAEG
jgi:hypothetical protein